ncbi:MAG: thioredoxin family protein [Parasphingopyxis sp.]|uniref:thioredoxin family protein n=1 Tax=Parasphingopyxis sp. TaxID=1920299 RepID=UPI0032EBD068
MRLFAAMALALAAVPAMTGAVATAAEAEHPEARPFDADRNAAADILLARARALMTGKRVLVVLGGNWCHDSRGLAGWFERPRFAEMLGDRYELVYVDVGRPQRGEGRNLDVAARYGIDEITGTPTVLVLSSSGRLLNPETATTWNNAASREEEAIYDYFADFIPETG